MSYYEGNHPDSKGDSSPGLQPKTPADAAHHARQSQPASRQWHWAWAQDTGHYDWMDAHAPFVDAAY